DPSYTRVMFARHPYLVGTPLPNIDETQRGTHLVHNGYGIRGEKFDLQKKPGIKRIVTLGGSSTYCVRVSQGDTWPELLARDLGGGYEVLNLGVPGYSTAENLIQTALVLSDLSPDIAIYYEGWNDVRDMHIKDLKPDYSNFHPRSQYHFLGFGNEGAPHALASIYYF